MIDTAGCSQHERFAGMSFGQLHQDLQGAYKKRPVCAMGARKTHYISLGLRGHDGHDRPCSRPEW